MGLEINANQSMTAVRPNFFSNPIQPIQNNFVKPADFVQKPDSFSINSDLSKYGSEKAIMDMVNANPEIMKILNEAKIPLKINMKTLDDLMKNHLAEARNVTSGVVNNLPQEFKTAINYQSLQKAAILHDLGKCLIPESIINKPGKLTEEEFQVMQKHAILSYEMLKTTDVDKDTLELIKNHHQNAQKTGYPQVEGAFVSDINLQILEAADMYTALREKRSYKPEMTKNQALAIIHQDVKDGKIHPYVFKALVDYANQEEAKSLAVVGSQVNPQGQVIDYQFVNRLSA